MGSDEIKVSLEKVTALFAEVERLKAENAKLKSHIKILEDTLSDSVPSMEEAEKILADIPNVSMSEKEIERIISYVKEQDVKMLIDHLKTENAKLVDADSCLDMIKTFLLEADPETNVEHAPPMFYPEWIASIWQKKTAKLREAAKPFVVRGPRTPVYASTEGELWVAIHVRAEEIDALRAALGEEEKP